MSENRKPEKKFWIGSIGVTIWKTIGKGSQPLYSCEFGRVFKDSEEFKESKYFNHDDLLNVAKLAERAEQFIAAEKDRHKAFEQYMANKKDSSDA